MWLPDRNIPYFCPVWTNSLSGYKIVVPLIDFISQNLCLQKSPHIHSVSIQYVHELIK